MERGTKEKVKRNVCFFLSSWDMGNRILLQVKKNKRREMGLLRSESAVNNLPLQLILNGFYHFMSLYANNRSVKFANLVTFEG